MAALALTSRQAAESLLDDAVGVGSLLTGLVLAAITLVLTVHPGVDPADAGTHWRRNALGVNLAVETGTASMLLVLGAIGLKSWAAGAPTAPGNALAAGGAFLLTANAVVVAGAARDFLHLAVVQIPVQTDLQERK